MSLDTSRTEYLLGREGVSRLKASSVAVFGVGGVGGYICESLARAGVGALTLIDGDKVSPSNANRQIIADMSTVGRDKVELMRERILLINPDCRVSAIKLFYLPENADSISLSAFSYVADAVDTVSAKLEIITRAVSAGVPVISAMGAGNKLYPEHIRIGDIAKTSVCPLARVMRRELRARGIHHLRVAWSDEIPRIPCLPHNTASENEDADTGTCGGDGGTVRRATPGSVSFVPSVMGLMIAGEIIRALAAVDEK